MTDLNLGRSDLGNVGELIGALNEFNDSYGDDDPDALAGEVLIWRGGEVIARLVLSNEGAGPIVLVAGGTV